VPREYRTNRRTSQSPANSRVVSHLRNGACRARPSARTGFLAAGSLQPYGQRQRDAQSPARPNRRQGFELSSCSSWARTRTLLIQSQVLEEAITDKRSGSEGLMGIGARESTVKYPEMSGETIAETIARHFLTTNLILHEIAD
jgi:hypothetical protein